MKFQELSSSSPSSSLLSSSASSSSSASRRFARLRFEPPSSSSCSSSPESSSSSRSDRRLPPIPRLSAIRPTMPPSSSSPTTSCISSSILSRILRLISSAMRLHLPFVLTGRRSGKARRSNVIISYTRRGLVVYSSARKAPITRSRGRERRKWSRLCFNCGLTFGGPHPAGPIRALPGKRDGLSLAAELSRVRAASCVGGVRDTLGGGEEWRMMRDRIA